MQSSQSNRSILGSQLADELDRDADALAERWRERARFVAPRRATSDAPPAECPDAEGTDIVRAIAGALRGEPASHDALMRAGWRYGSSCRRADLSLHLVLKELELMSAMTLYACERAAERDTTATAADGLRVAREVQRCVSVLVLAAAKGFTHTYLGEVQERLRTLRHDLRNPIGTIKSAVSFMEDESVAPELRSHPRFRAMVQRNAASLESLIGKRLTGDGATPAFVEQQVALRDVVLGVRRAVRDEAEAAGCEIETAEDMPATTIDAVGVELALRSIVSAGIRALGGPGVVRIEAENEREDVTTLVVRAYTSAGEPAAVDDNHLGFAREMAQQWGGRLLLTHDGVRIEIPIYTARAEPASTARTRATPLSAPSVDQRNDLGRAD